MDILIVGKITGSHGVAGDMKLLPLVDDISSLFVIKDAYIVNQQNEIQKEVCAAGWKIAGGRIFLLLEGVDSREKAKLFSGSYVAVKREHAPIPPSGRYFITDLIGLMVEDKKRGTLGVLKDILQTGAHDVLLIQREKKKDLLIPYLHSIVEDVFLEEKRILVALPEGLFEIYDS